MFVVVNFMRLYVFSLFLLTRGVKVEVSVIQVALPDGYILNHSVRCSLYFDERHFVGRFFKFYLFFIIIKC